MNNSYEPGAQTELCTSPTCERSCYLLYTEIIDVIGSLVLGLVWDQDLGTSPRFFYFLVIVFVESESYSAQ